MNPRYLLYPIGAALVGVLVFFLTVNKRQPEAPTAVPTEVVKQTTPATIPGTETTAPVKSPPEATALPANELIDETSPTGEKPAPRQPTEIKEVLVEPTEFTRADLAFADSDVHIELGEYEVAAGAEFQVDIRATAPALANFSVLMHYDPELLEYIPESAHTVGETFLSGIEFYAKQNEGRMIMISSGNPGEKHTEMVNDDVVASFRMRSRRSGDADFDFPKKGTIFLSASGTTLAYSITGGRISIQ